MAVERLSYFTGLFLEVKEFTLEQSYHLEMRRRLNFGLFTPGILFGLTVVREAVDRVRVDPGMAVDSNQVENQGREIVLTGSRTINLSTFANGDQVYITISYHEQPTTPKPPINVESRITEDPIIEAFRDTGAGFTGDKNLKIILAKVRVGDLSPPDLSERQLAQNRLGSGAGPSTGAPTITNITFNNPTNQGVTVQITITGTNLGNNPQVTILDNVNNPDANITATINAGSSNNTTLVVDLVIGASAALGGRRVRVQTSSGIIISNANTFTVNPPVPVINSISPSSGRQTVSVPITITGANLSPNPVVTILPNNSNIADTNIAVTLGAVTATTVSVTLSIGSAAAPGGRQVRIQTASGVATSPVDFFTVRAAPVIKSISQTSQAVGQPITIRGSDIRDDTLNPGNPAAGTTIRFVDPANSANFVLGTNPTVLSNVSTAAGPQRVEVTVPPRGTLPANPNPVNIILQIEGATAVSPQQFTFP